MLYFLAAVLLYGICLIPFLKGEVGMKQKAASYGMICLCMSLFNPNAWRNAFLPTSAAYFILFAFLSKEKWKDRTAIALAGISFALISLTSEALLGEKGVKAADLYSVVTFGALFLFAALLRLRSVESA